MPQESIPGPLLLLVNIDVLLRVAKNSATPIYADEMDLCLKSNDLSQINEALSQNISLIDSWLNCNMFSFNAAKTQSMFFSTKAKRNPLDR